MTLITRMTRLFKADIHGILDCLEEPNALLRQAVRDMEVEIEKGDLRSKALRRDRADLSRRKEQLIQHLGEVEKNIDLSFLKENETLARTFVRRKLEVVDRIRGVQDKAQAIDAEIEALDQQLQEQREKRDSIVEKMNLFVDEVPESTNASFWSEGCGSSVTEEDVEVAFFQERERRAKTESKESARG